MKKRKRKWKQLKHECKYFCKFTVIRRDKCFCDYKNLMVSYYRFTSDEIYIVEDWAIGGRGLSLCYNQH
jgi:hypothetical protein